MDDMLTDVRFGRPDSELGIVLSMLGAGKGPTIPEKIERGMYVCGHWSIDLLAPGIPNAWDMPKLPIPTYGVCDSPEQFKAKFDCDGFEEPVFVTFVRICRADQPHSGGWRWHKWGEYIGKQNPQCEYLHDEPNIEEVYTFSVHHAPPDKDVETC